MLFPPLLLLYLAPLTAAPTTQAGLDLTVRYQFYACDPCPYAYLVERSATPAGQSLVGRDVAVRYRGQPLGETTAFPAGLTTSRCRFRIRGQLRRRGLLEFVSGNRTVEATAVMWLR